MTARDRRVVVRPTPAYRAAVAELPLRTRPSTRSRRGDRRRARRTATGATRVRAPPQPVRRAVVVADPESRRPPRSARSQPSVGGIPVILERPLLRPDAASDAAAGRAATDAQRRAARRRRRRRARPDLELVLRDAIAWARVLAGGALAGCVHASGASRFLNDAGRTAAPLSRSTSSRSTAGGSWIRAHALGEVRHRGRGRRAERTIVTTATSRRTADRSRRRFETSQRLALRRALDALDGRRISRSTSPSSRADAAARPSSCTARRQSL